MRHLEDRIQIIIERVHSAELLPDQYWEENATLFARHRCLRETCGSQVAHYGMRVAYDLLHADMCTEPFMVGEAQAIGMMLQELSAALRCEKNALVRVSRGLSHGLRSRGSRHAQQVTPVDEGVVFNKSRQRNPVRTRVIDFYAPSGAYMLQLTSAARNKPDHLFRAAAQYLARSGMDEKRIAFWSGESQGAEVSDSEKTRTANMLRDRREADVTTFRSWGFWRRRPQGRPKGRRSTKLAK